jgi:hypothetical protein
MRLSREQNEEKLGQTIGTASPTPPENLAIVNVLISHSIIEHDLIALLTCRLNIQNQQENGRHEHKH